MRFLSPVPPGAGFFGLAASAFVATSRHWRLLTSSSSSAPRLASLLMQRLNSCNDRDLARQILAEFANRDALAAFARSQKIHVVKHDRREELEDKVIEFVIGRKLRTEAIRTLNLKAGSISPE